MTGSDIFKQIADLLPPHEGGLMIWGDDHKSCYRTVAQEVEAQEHGCRDRDWVSEEEKQKAIEINSYWKLQWYPHTPNGFHVVSASSLEALLAYCQERKAANWE